MNQHQLNTYKKQLRAKGYIKEEIDAAINNLWYDEGIRVFPTHTEKANGDGSITIRIPKGRRTSQ
jgi:hypothetical protein